MKTEYALRALFEISEASASSDRNSTIHRKQIAERQEIPLAYLEQILIALKKNGLIRSTKGPGGGYSLAKPREEITVWDIYSAVDRPAINGEQCFPGLKTECERISVCKIKNVWGKVNSALRESMENLNLHNLTA